MNNLAAEVIGLNATVTFAKAGQSQTNSTRWYGKTPWVFRSAFYIKKLRYKEVRFVKPLNTKVKLTS